MELRHPFQSIPQGRRARVFLPLLALTLLVMAALTLIGEPLKTAEAPHGILSFEFAGDASQARRMIDSWDETTRIHAALSLGLDYLFLFAYPATIGLACVWAADLMRERKWPLVSTGILLAWGQAIAGALDAIENAALIKLLIDSIESPWPQIAYWCAAVKFALVIAGLLYLIFGAAVKIMALGGHRSKT